MWSHALSNSFTNHWRVNEGETIGCKEPIPVWLVLDWVETIRCDICWALLSGSRNLQYHRRIHTCEEVWSQLAFALNGQLNAIRICESAVSQSIGLMNHIKIGKHISVQCDFYETRFWERDSCTNLRNYINVIVGKLIENCPPVGNFKSVTYARRHFQLNSLFEDIGEQW